MEPYLYIFALNLFLAYLVEKNFDNNKTLSKLIIVLMIIINTLFSGLRDIGVGLDTTIYIDSYFYTASNLTSFKELINIDLDKGYLILAYLASVFQMTVNRYFLPQLFLSTFSFWLPLENIAEY